MELELFVVSVLLLLLVAVGVEWKDEVDLEELDEAVEEEEEEEVGEASLLAALAFDWSFLEGW